MKKLRLYLDNCCFNRPYDDQSSIKVKFETEAKLYIQSQIKDGNYLLIWSYILDYENNMNPYESRKNSIAKWKILSKDDVDENPEILNNIDDLEKYKIIGKDAIHIACALFSKVDYFITTDYLLIRKSASLNQLKVLNPVDFIKIMEGF